MFGTRFYSVGSDRKLNDAALVFQAMTVGRPPAEREAAGAMCPPWGILVDTQEVNLDGRATPIRTSMRFAVAACRHGDQDFLRGLLSQPALFDYPVGGEWRESMEFAHDPLSIACASVLLARGDFESLQVLLQNAQTRAQAEADQPPSRGRRHESFAPQFLSLDSKSAETLFWNLAQSKGLGQAQIKQGFHWIRERCAPALAPKACAYLLDAATQTGADAALSCALDLGATPTPADAVRAASQGAFESAKRMAAKTDPKAFCVNPGEKESSICKALADSLSSTLPHLALGLSEWRDPRSTSMESTLFSYVHNRDKVHLGAQMALAGDFDLPDEDPVALERAKDQIASCLRALEQTSFPDLAPIAPAARSLRPNAPASASELQFLAVHCPEGLPQALEQAAPGEGDRFCDMAIERHRDAIRRDGFSSRSHPDASAERSRLLVERAQQALFEIFHRDSSLISPGARDKLMAHARTQPGLAEAFEREAIERAAAPAKGKSRGPLKA